MKGRYCYILLWATWKGKNAQLAKNKNLKEMRLEH